MYNYFTVIISSCRFYKYKMYFMALQEHMWNVLINSVQHKIDFKEKTNRQMTILVCDETSNWGAFMNFTWTYE